MSNMYVMDQNCFVNNIRKLFFYISIHLDNGSVLIIKH
jgi:sRNA-binding regulator protein Hfq